MNILQQTHTNSSPSFAQKPHVLPWQHRLIGALIIILLLIFIIINEIYFPHPQFSGNKILEIPSGFGSRMIAAKLKHEGFIRSKWIFIIYATVRGKASFLKPGTYDFDHVSILEITDTLVKGSTREMITLPEGATIDDLAQILENHHIASSAMFADFAMRAHAQELTNIYPILAQIPAQASLEGYLFPDTYHLFKDASPADIAGTFLQNFDKKITPEIRNDIARSGHTLHEIIIMASLIEKEVVSDEDRKMVSGILWNRLRLGIPLQVDATISYIKKQANIPLALNGRISRDDLMIESPYNTYARRGLPQGPIGNPGLSVIMAVLNPISSDYLYYLSAPDGRTIYSRTLKEHNLAKRKYLTK